MERPESSLIKISESITPDIEIKAVIKDWPQEINIFSKEDLDPLIIELVDGTITKNNND